MASGGTQPPECHVRVEKAGGVGCLHRMDGFPPHSGETQRAPSLVGEALPSFPALPSLPLLCAQQPLLSQLCLKHSKCPEALGLCSGGFWLLGPECSSSGELQGLWPVLPESLGSFP